MADKPIPPITPAKDIEVDVVIVGAGTGMAAALSAHEAGLSTLIIEKSQYMGGSTALSGGAFWIPGNKVLRNSGADYDQKRAHLYLENVVGDSAPKERWEAFLEHGPAAVDVMVRNTPLEFMWCKDYSDYHSDLPGSAPSSRSVESKPFNAAILGKERPRLRPSALGAPIPMPVTGVDYKWMNLMAKVPQ
ncbi:FAD-binding protein, partial [Timonella senegalensis]|uniref:FAD-binding protein n=1 Tax=Timonella senegalensis TaxID=1465825 RepID=UPI002FE15080